MKEWRQRFPMGLCLGQCFPALCYNIALLLKESTTVLKLLSVRGSVLQTYCCTATVFKFMQWPWTSRVMDGGSLKAVTMWQLCVNGWPSLFCRAQPELKRRRLLTRPRPSSPESSTALSRNISRPSTSESPSLIHHTLTCHECNVTNSNNLAARL